MGIFDRFRHHKDNAGGAGTAVKDRLTGMASSHSSQVDQGLDKAGQLIDDKTGNKYGDQINTGVAKAKGMYGGQTGQRDNATDQTIDMPIHDAGAQGGDPSQPPQS